MKCLFYNGKILTMETPCPLEAMIIDGDTILAVGSLESLSHIAKGAEHIDLQGKTLMPSFIDSHGHLSSYATSFLQASLENAASFPEVIERLRTFGTQSKLKDGDWLIAGNYDHNKLKEHRHPNKTMLDKAFSNLKVVLQHQSGHFGVLNSAGLEAVGMTGKDKEGYLEENEYVTAAKRLPLPEMPQLVTAYAKALRCYASYGITTLQEGLMVSQMMPIYRMLLSENILTLDVVGYPQISDAELFYSRFSENAENYRSGFRLGGCKIILDGSPQGRTAWMKTPYAGTTDSFGVSCLTDEAVFDAIQNCLQNNRQLLAHCNGDNAAEQYLRCAEMIQERTALAALRPVMIHAQLLETKQLPRLKKLGMIPSFFAAHCYHWGDVHIKNFGKPRAEKISPAGSAARLGLPFTFHQDAPVIEPNMLETVWCAVNRTTKIGVTLGKDECIPVYEALKAVTVNAAYQYGEESSKGRLSSGMKADFIILDHDPLTVPSQEIRDIRVLETYKSGVCVYSEK